MSKEVSVVVATHNRRALLVELLRGLARQTFPPSRFEVVIVDDGSSPPVRPDLEALAVPYELTLIEQANQGASAARHHGILRARGDIIVIVDDDMRVPPDFLAQHVEAHARGITLVLGNILGDGDAMAAKPIFERMHATLLERQWAAFRSGLVRPSGAEACTGNLSFRRRDYVAVGGFDPEFLRSEDRELGVHLEKTGARVGFADAARTIHKSDITDLALWMRRNFLAGQYDLRIARKHAEMERADPWRFFFLIDPASRVLVAATLIAPRFGAGLAWMAIQVSMALDALGADRPALAGATLCYGLTYFRGVRHEAGSFREVVRTFRAYSDKRARSESRSLRTRSQTS